MKHRLLFAIDLTTAETLGSMARSGITLCWLNGSVRMVMGETVLMPEAMTLAQMNWLRLHRAKLVEHLWLYAEPDPCAPPHSRSR